MDCGPTCVRMVARYYGRIIPIQELREKAYITRQGVSMLGISDSAESIGLRTTGVRISFSALRRASSMPCIVHWRQQHFIVVYKVTIKKVFVADPAVGLIDYSIEDFKKGWISSMEQGAESGIALLLEPTQKFYENDYGDQSKNRIRFRDLLGYLKHHKNFVIQLVFGLLVGSMIQLAFPFLTQSIVDVGINTRNIQFIYLVLLGQGFLFIGKLSVELIRRWILLYLSARINISLVSDFLAKIFKLPVGFFEGKQIGDILRRIEDNSRIERFLSSSTLSAIFSLFNLIIFATILAAYSFKIFAVFSLFSVAFIGYQLLFIKKRSELDYKRFQQSSNSQSTLIQTMQGMAEIKANNCETQKRWQWEQIQARLFHINVESNKFLQIQEAGSLLLNESKNILITVMTALSVVNGEMTLGMMLSTQYIIGQLNAPLNEFVVITRDFHDARIALERLSEIHSLDNEETSSIAHHLNDGLSSHRSIAIRNLSFQYEGPHSRKVLDNLNFVIPAGKVTAIVGSSGSGKTTMLKLLLKFYKPTAGSIEIEGHPLENFPTGSWRQYCGAVMQDGFIFSDTIARNIVLGEDSIDSRRLVNAVEIANIRRYVESLPLGYSTKIGPNGLGLSQGQKQRILIARAVYKNPSFLLFDEATSALDANNERVIMENLDEFFHGKTVLVIAHRLSTVRNADQILVFENGQIVESGTHDHLVDRKGNYFDLVKNQLELGT